MVYKHMHADAQKTRKIILVSDTLEKTGKVFKLLSQRISFIYHCTTKLGENGESLDRPGENMQTLFNNSIPTERLFVQALNPEPSCCEANLCHHATPNLWLAGFEPAGKNLMDY